MDYNLGFIKMQSPVSYDSCFVCVHVHVGVRTPQVTGKAVLHSRLSSRCLLYDLWPLLALNLIFSIFSQLPEKKFPFNPVRLQLWASE